MLPMAKPAIFTYFYSMCYKVFGVYNVLSFDHVIYLLFFLKTVYLNYTHEKFIHVTATQRTTMTYIFCIMFLCYCFCIMFLCCFLFLQ